MISDCQCKKRATLRFNFSGWYVACNKRDGMGRFICWKGPARKRKSKAIQLWNDLMIKGGVGNDKEAI
jgi:hypothetical protein